ncbi:MAG: tRNA (adenosine(37)-N6)-threonylcarbamoyltransferase complex ATPase subunit type 1 TsaE [Patescibacteria group bacterium]|mgnify:FL=1
MQYRSNTPEQTKKIAAEVAQTLKAGDVLFLEGNLGSGKTTFVQGLVEAFRYDGPVRSPTFAIMNVYPTSHPTIQKIVHVDLYRLADASELRTLALEECLEDPNALVIVEWPHLLEPLIKKPYTKITFAFLENEARLLTIEKYP